MPPIYNATVKTARMNATRSAVANGSLDILTAADAVLVTFGLDATAGAVSGNRWTLGFDSATVTATGTGTAAKARIRDSGGVVRVTGLAVGQEVTLDNTNIATGQEINMTSAIVDHAPDPA